MTRSLKSLIGLSERRSSASGFKWKYCWWYNQSGARGLIPVVLCTIPGDNCNLIFQGNLKQENVGPWPQHDSLCSVLSTPMNMSRGLPPSGLYPTDSLLASELSGLPRDVVEPAEIDRPWKMLDLNSALPLPSQTVVEVFQDFGPNGDVTTYYWRCIIAKVDRLCMRRVSSTMMEIVSQPSPVSAPPLNCTHGVDVTVSCKSKTFYFEATLPSHPFEPVKYLDLYPDKPLVSKSTATWPFLPKSKARDVHAARLHGGICPLNANILAAHFYRRPLLGASTDGSDRRKAIACRANVHPFNDAMIALQYYLRRPGFRRRRNSRAKNDSKYPSGLHQPANSSQELDI
ncbi:hypothetical protein FISHEDRAFT_60374 [Fistulina hepatica ATCC 64428]|uniref:Uncharacterized protein n=1 Tax=Fistulina hepatica ATCC 64428 TaxID=1128425 RepID=A0A0D7A6H0_9AGAR|nr:hypothetical protein FISHEDRAFT_60374 [Fistulina hepatica ATCC 64428]